MAFLIDATTCGNCGSCKSECPNEAILEKGEVHWIDPEKCVDCGSCKEACPCDAISEA
ncbi:MAG: 4Fe-4S binding protein [Spirochaetaceae bacterium]|jgi:NAD-dependent dihydropyrimidine dehydrogenase PreA subunit|nr:4Fe-4S binding protein [Spirochaetaceae bacterium]